MRKFNPANHFFVVSTLLRYGHSAAEPVRSAFVFFLLSFADLDGYPRRAALKQAFSPMGSYSDRLVCCCALKTDPFSRVMRTEN